MFNQLTFSNELPITLDEAKDHLRLSMTDFDGMLYSLIGAAADVTETYINSPLYATDWQYFPTDLHFPFVIPKGQVQTVTSFEYQTADAVWHTLSTNSWDSKIESGRCTVFLKPFVVIAWPVLYTDSPFRITFTAGFVEGGIPERVKLAVKMLVGNMFNQTDNQVPEMLLNQYRCWFKEMF